MGIMRQVRVGSKTVYANDDEYKWILAEAKRRNVTIAEVMRDAMRAYRKLVPEAAAFDADTRRIRVDF